MEEQQQLSHTPVARNTDPITSHMAASEITVSGVRSDQCRQVLALVAMYPDKTSFELSTRSRDLDRYQVARRISDLEHAGVVRKNGKRACFMSGRKAVTWVVAKDWRAAI